MTPDRWQRMQEVFSSAVERSGAARALFVESACADDAELRVEVERLLRTQEKSDAFLESPLSPANDEPALLPERIGSYRLIRLIASGGMGIVYEAEQDQPRRTVALKVARTALVSSWARQRFRHEAQILARLRHPGIAQVYEAGTYSPMPGEPPVPYFAMEFVDGAREVTAYAEGKSLPLADRLRLFIKVCEAVEYGNRQGIVHRDLKPANLLVDGSGTPKVIDFGLARAVGPDSGLLSAETEPGRIIGTLAYMSPEHLGGDAHDIDARSDAYSLGVVLYELVCARHPYDLHSKPLAEAARLIQSEPPARPSTINPACRGDLETIILKALDKDRERRYQSAGDLGRDIERLLRHDPIEARAPSAVYRIRKFVRRRWALVCAGAIAAAALLAATVVSGVFAYSESQVAKEEARQRAIAGEVAALLFGTLSSADPAEAGPDSTVREMLERTVEKIDSRGASLRPEVEAAVRGRLGRSFLGLSEFRSARRQFEGAIAATERGKLPPSGETLLIMEGLATACQRMSDGEAAMRWAEREEALAESMKGVESVEYSRALMARSSALMLLRRYPESQRAAQRALELRERLLGPGAPPVAEALGGVAVVEHMKGRYAKAEALLRRAVEIARGDADSGAGELRLASVLGNLGVTLNSQGKAEEAEALHREAIEIMSKRLRPEHATIQIARIRLCLLLERRGEWAEAEKLHRQNYESLRSAREFAPADVAIAADRWAAALVKLERFEEAERVLRQGLEVRGESGAAMGTRQMMAQVLLRLGKPAEAEEFARSVLELVRGASPSGHPAVSAEPGFVSPQAAARRGGEMSVRSLLGECLMEQGRLVEAGPMLMESYAALSAMLADWEGKPPEALPEAVREAERRVNRLRELAQGGVSR